MSDADFTPLRVTYRAPGLDTSRRIRAWAQAEGYPVSGRGRLARAPGASPEDYEWQRDSRLGDIYTIVFVRGLDEREVLRRLGAADEDIRLIGDGDFSCPEGPEVITVRRIGDWTVAIEDGGLRGAEREALGALSRDGGEAVAVQRHDPIPAALALASRITGVMIGPQHLRRPVLGAAIPA